MATETALLVLTDPLSTSIFLDCRIDERHVDQIVAAGA